MSKSLKTSTNPLSFVKKFKNIINYTNFIFYCPCVWYGKGNDILFYNSRKDWHYDWKNDTNDPICKEEIANAITHGIGAILSIPALIILIIHASKHGTASAVVAFTVYGVSMFLLYLFSTLLHSIHHQK